MNANDAAGGGDAGLDGSVVDSPPVGVLDDAAAAIADGGDAHDATTDLDASDSAPPDAAAASDTGAGDAWPPSSSGDARGLADASGAEVDATSDVNVDASLPEGGAADGGLPVTIVNGGFEAGDLTGWDTPNGAGVTSVGCPFGTYCAVLGSGGKITQTFTAPVGATLLVSWSKLTCVLDSSAAGATAPPVFYLAGWLHDKTAGNPISPTSFINEMCPPLSGWTRATVPVVAGHEYEVDFFAYTPPNGSPMQGLATIDGVALE